MSLVPPPPAGSRIEYREAPGKFELRIPLPNGLQTRLVTGILVLVFCLVVIFEVAAASLLAYILLGGEGKGGGAVAAFLSLWLAGWTCGLILTFKGVRRLIRRDPERIALTRETLDFDLGAFSGVLEVWPELPTVKKFLLRADSVQGTWLRSEIDAVAILAGRHGPKVVVDRGEDRTRLGWGLAADEREWLRRLLAAWKYDELGL